MGRRLLASQAGALWAAGLGAEVANSFLVAAARHDAGLDRITDNTAIAWNFSSDRLKC